MNKATGNSTFLAALLVLLMSSPMFAWAAGKGELQDIVDVSTAVLNDFRSKEEVQALLAQARGVIIYPSIKKGALGVGGERGTGVLAGRNDAGAWSNPAFMTYSALSFGMQAGVESSAILMIVMNQETLQSLLDGKVEFGTNATIAAGDEFDAKGKLLSTDQLADIYYFARVKGAFAGLNMKGGVNDSRDEFNATYYGKEASAKAVVTDRAVQSKGAATLVKALSR